MRRIDLSATQVIASVMATVTGALAASYLGVAGTLIGAAVASFAGTTGTAVYRHYLARTEERLRAAANTVVPLAAARAVHARHPAPGDPARAAASLQDHPPDAARPAAAASGAERYPQPDPARALARLESLRESGVAEPGPAAGQAGRPGSRGSGTGAGPSGASGPLTARPAGSVPGPAAGQIVLGVIRMGEPAHTSPSPAAAGDGAGAAATRALRGAGQFGKAHWRSLLALTAGVFVLVIGAITVVEAMTGKPLEAVLWGRHASGTTVSDVVSGNSGPAPAPRPSGTPTPPGSPAPASPSPRGSATPSPQPSPSRTPSVSPSSTLPVSPPPTAVPAG